jgi:hypothetical protein
VGFTFLALEFNCWENYDDGNIYDYRNSTNYHCGFSGPNPPVYGASIFAAIISSLQVVLGMYATSVVCWPPHTRLMSDYIVWIILTLCEVPWFLAGWAFAFIVWRAPYEVTSAQRGYIFVATVPAIAFVTSCLSVTATLTHSFRARNESITEHSPRMEPNPNPSNMCSNTNASPFIYAPAPQVQERRHWAK